MHVISKLENFLHGQSWSSRYARISLPVLVSLAERHTGKPDDEIPEFTYKDLAIAVRQPNHARPIHHALGTLGFALKELEEKQRPDLGRIPPIQLLVWSDGQGSPGDDGFVFMNIFKEDLAKMSPALRRTTARHVRAEIINYPHWRNVLAELSLKPLTLNLPSAETVIASPNFDLPGGGESPEHFRLKSYLGTHYQAVGITGQFKASFEVPMLSGDKLDLMLDEVSGRRRFCFEAKSRLSNENASDLIRGLFQCVKYRAVLLAQERYEAAKASKHSVREIEVLLATERDLPDDLQQLCILLDVKCVTVRIPKNYQCLPV